MGISPLAPNWELMLTVPLLFTSTYVVPLDGRNTAKGLLTLGLLS